MYNFAINVVYTIIYHLLRFTAYMLADLGYDVWLGNARGNTYSRSHVNITADDPEFWKFTYVSPRYPSI